MKSHELAKILLNNPNLPIATHANNHLYLSDARSYEELRIALLMSYAGEHIIVGNFTRKLLNGTSYFVDKVLDGKEDLPNNWGD